MNNDALCMYTTLALNKYFKKTKELLLVEKKCFGKLKNSWLACQ